MSYSFSIGGDTKDEAAAKVKAEFDNVVIAQPSHVADKQAAQDATVQLIRVLREPAERECVEVHANGSLSWREEGCFTGASLSISAYLVAKI